ncbi:MAG: glutamyl-tRNA reductase [Legionella sp.]|nr:MAG: glutamyl-tRNA reductase [Legionella sp.]
MVFIACGLNHKTAPLTVREKVAHSPEKQKNLLDVLLDESDINEALLLSTCNRTELYCDTQNPQQLMSWFAKYHHMSLEQLQPYFYLLEDHDAVKHAVRVASGLDSMMLGEPQILGQMKQAFQIADANNAIGTNLRHIFQFVFGASKRIRNQSGVGQHATSIAFAASKLIQQRFSNAADVSVLLIGSGETATLVAKYLYQQGVRQFMITSRSDDHASKLADLCAGAIMPIQDMTTALTKADVVVSATACPYPFISQSMIIDVLEVRQQAPMFFLDLAVPRDIESNVGALENVTLYNIDDMDRLTQAGMQQRHAAATHAEKLIDFELKAFMDNHRALRAKELICDYRSTMQALAEQELQRAMQKLAKGHQQFDVMTEFSERLIKKFTHMPTKGLRQAALDQRDEVLDLAHYLFHSSQSSYEDLT